MDLVISFAPVCVCSAWCAVFFSLHIGPSLFCTLFLSLTSNKLFALTLVEKLMSERQRPIFRDCCHDWNSWEPSLQWLWQSHCALCCVQLTRLHCKCSIPSGRFEFKQTVGLQQARKQRGFCWRSATTDCYLLHLWSFHCPREGRRCRVQLSEPWHHRHVSEVARGLSGESLCVDAHCVLYHHVALCIDDAHLSTSWGGNQDLSTFTENQWINNKPWTNGWS